MLSNKNIFCPENLLKIAKDKGPVNAVIVNAVKKVAIESVKSQLSKKYLRKLIGIFQSMKLFTNQMKIVQLQ